MAGLCRAAVRPEGNRRGNGGPQPPRCGAGRGSPPPTHIAGALRTLSVRPDPVEACPEALEGPVLRALGRGMPSTTTTPRIQKHPDTTPLPPRRPLPYPPPMHHARKHTGHKPTTPRMPQQPAQNASENTQNPLVLDKTSRICRGQFCRRLVSHPEKTQWNRIEVSTAEEPPGAWEPPRDEICNKPETNTPRRRATLNAT